MTLSEKAKLRIVGSIKPYLMIKYCECCQNIFIMSNDDYITKQYGVDVKNQAGIPGPDGWCCKECANKIKNI